MIRPQCLRQSNTETFSTILCKRKRIYLHQIEENSPVHSIAGFSFFQTGTRDLMMVPGLVLHFLEHKLDEPDLTFAEFMHTHYCKDLGHEHTHNHCGNLPFGDDDLPLPHFQVIEEHQTELVL